MTSITMPQLGESVAEGTIGRWLKSPGERIERDEPLVEVITDKVTAEIPSPVAGVVESLAVPEGETVPVGQEIAVIADASATGQASPAAAEQPAGPAELAAGEAQGPASPAAPPGPQGSPASAPVDAPHPVGAGLAPPAPALVARPPEAQDQAAATETPESTPESGERRRASPLVRRLAREHNVDLSQVRGSGAGGRVTKDDILSFVQSRPAAPAAAAEAPAAPAATPAQPAPQVPQVPAAPTPTPAPPAPAPGADEEYLPLSPIRKAIAEHMVRSKQVSPDAWGLVEVDVTGLARLRESLLADWQRREGFELTFLPFFIKSVVEALREHPILNSSWGEDRIILKRRVNIGVAVAVESGLVVPVIHDADQKSIAGLAHAVRDLAGRARTSKLGLPDIQGGTFTVNNTGALGSIMSAPIINQPQAAIVTMEAIVKRPVVLADDAIAIRSMMNVCLTFDHRILDGAAALRFLQSVKRRLEAYAPGTTVY